MFPSCVGAKSQYTADRSLPNYVMAKKRGCKDVTVMMAKGLYEPLYPIVSTRDGMSAEHCCFWYVCTAANTPHVSVFVIVGMCVVWCQ